MTYVTGYMSIVPRLLYSFFVQTPIEIWYRWLSLVIPQNKVWINESNTTESVLQQYWETAQSAIATAPWPTTDEDAPMHAPDPRALTVEPANVTVVSVQDAPQSELVSATGYAGWLNVKSPSGTILEPSGTGYAPCHAFSCCWKRPRVYAAASQIPAVLQYEFENVILSQLGYDVSQR